MPLKVTRRKDTGALTISGTVKLPDGARVRVRARAGSDDKRLAEEEAGALEARILRDAWHGERRGTRSFAEAVENYLTAVPRAAGDKARLRRIMLALGDVTISEVNQAAVNRVRIKTLAPAASPATIRRGVITPLRAVLNHANALGWCDAPKFTIPKQPEGRTRYLLPEEAERLVAAAAPHIATIVIFLLDTGARLSEALEMDWRDVDLVGARVRFWRTKSGRRRDATLSPRAVAMLGALAHREGRVIRWRVGNRTAEYADRDRQGGGQIKTAWRRTLCRAGLDPDLTPHDLRHSWASWHYALHRDLLALKLAGGWSSVSQVERYAHLLPSGQEETIRAFRHESDTGHFRGEVRA